MFTNALKKIGVVMFAFSLMFIASCGDKGGDSTPTTVATTLVPLLTDSCDANDAHEAAANDAYTQAKKEANKAYEKAITEIDTEDDNVTGKVEAITKTRDNAIKAAKVTKTNALETVQVNREACLRLADTSNAKPNDTGTDEPSDSDDAALVGECKNIKMVALAPDRDDFKFGDDVSQTIPNFSNMSDAQRVEAVRADQHKTWCEYPAIALANAMHYGVRPDATGAEWTKQLNELKDPTTHQKLVDDLVKFDQTNVKSIRVEYRKGRYLTDWFDRSGDQVVRFKGESRRHDVGWVMVRELNNGDEIVNVLACKYQNWTPMPMAPKSSTPRKAHQPAVPSTPVHFSPPSTPLEPKTGIQANTNPEVPSGQQEPGTVPAGGTIGETVNPVNANPVTGVPGPAHSEPTEPANGGTVPGPTTGANSATTATASAVNV